METLELDGASTVYSALEPSLVRSFQGAMDCQGVAECLAPLSWYLLYHCVVVGPRGAMDCQGVAVALLQSYGE